jgi:hypothetical protein
MYTYIQESISQGTSMNKYFEGIGCLWFSFWSPSFYTTHHRCLEQTNDTSSDGSVVEQETL